MMVTLLLPSLLVILLKFCIEDIGSLALNVIHEDGGQLATNFLSQLEPDVAELVSLRYV